jgi:hypothetical protein
MRFLCLCPIYNHPKRLIENAMACFINQEYKNATLLLGDDGPGYSEFRKYYNSSNNQDQDIHLTRFSKRLGSIGEKCQEMYKAAVDIGIQFDAIALWDDDDIYLAHHLSGLAEVLESCPGIKWAKSQFVGSTYGGSLHLEPAAGRFWASIGMKRDMFEKIGGFVQTRSADFDQQMLAKLNAKAGEPVDSKVTYIYRWEDTQANHCSGAMKNPKDESWWDKVPVVAAAGTLVPKFDEITKALWMTEPYGFLQRPLGS